MELRIALAGNPNSGKTTLFNALTGSNQFVGNWPGVTIEKKEGKLKKHNDIIIADLPGVYSLSPYTLEEVVARNYLLEERPDAILNIVDGTNLERNLYLTTQLTELGIPVVVAVNMMDVVRKNGDKIHVAGTIILLSSIVLWFLQSFGTENGSFGMVEDMNNSILAVIGSAVAWIFAPLGFGNWQSAVATVTGLIAKENVVGTFGVLFGGFDEVAENGWQIWSNMRAVFSPLAAYSFLAFNLLCAPCFAAMGAIRREMHSGKWTAFAIAYQCAFAYAVSLVIYQFGMLFTGAGNVFGAIAAFLIVAFFIFMLVRPEKKKSALQK